MADPVRLEVDESEPDISDDDMGLDPLYTPEEIKRIQADAHQADAQAPGAAAAANAPEGEEPETKNKRKEREVMTSPMWKHYKKGRRKPNGFYDATCNYCGKVFQMGKGRGTGSMKNHTFKSCKKIPNSKKYKPDVLQRMLQAGTAVAPKLAVWQFDQMRSRKGLARMVIAHDYPFNCVSHHYLKEFLRELQPEFKMITRNTLRKDCLNIYDEEKLMLYDQLALLDCKFSFTSDLWSNKGRDRGFMSLTCHYIDDTWHLRKRVIAFCPLESPHTGVAIADAIFHRFVLWNMDKKVFCLVLDSSSANDACIKAMFNTTPIKEALPVEGSIFHQRCGCHILNLIVQDGLAALGDEITCIRDTIKYIRHSQSRMERFQLAVAQVKVKYNKPIWDVQTRWNSTYTMLNKAFELKDAILRFATLDKSFTLDLSNIDWDKMKELLGCLKIFYIATLKLSGTKYPTINLFFPEFCEISLSIKKMGRSSHPFIVSMSKVMFEKWDKYWTNGNMLLAIACVLDPRSKLHIVEYYMKQMYPATYVTFMDNLNKCMTAMFKEYVEAYSKSVDSQAVSTSQHMRQPAVPEVETDTRAGLRDFIRGKRVCEPQKSELEEYFSEALDVSELDAEFDILSWWRLKAVKYPVLSRLTRDILAVPISTVASESTFSIGGRTLSPVRSCLNDESVEALICAQDWLKASVTENGGEFGEDLWCTDDVVLDDDDVGTSRA